MMAHRGIKSKITFNPIPTDYPSVQKAVLKVGRVSAGNNDSNSLLVTLKHGGYQKVCSKFLVDRLSSQNYLNGRIIKGYKCYRR